MQLCEELNCKLNDSYVRPVLKTLLLQIILREINAVITG